MTYQSNSHADKQRPVDDVTHNMFTDNGEGQTPSATNPANDAGQQKPDNGYRRYHGTYGVPLNTDDEFWRTRQMLARMDGPLEVRHITPGGRTGAAIYPSEPLWDILRNTGADWHFVKRNSDPWVSELEFNLYTRLRERGLPVPIAAMADEKTLHIEPVEGIPLSHMLCDLYREVCWGMMPREQYLTTLDSLLDKSMRLATDVDMAVDSVLTDMEKIMLQQQRYGSIARRYGVDFDDAVKNEHTYRCADALEVRDARTLELLAPLNERIRADSAQHGKWLWGGYANNIIVTKDFDVRAIDFNNPQFSPIQETDTFLFDAYLPCKSWTFDDHPTPLSEQDKWMLMRRRVDYMNAQGLDVDVETYSQGVNAIRAERNLRLFSHALRDVTKPMMLHGIVYDSFREALNARQNALNALHELRMEDERFAPLFEHVHHLTGQKLKSLQPVYDQLIAEMRSL